MDEFREYLSQYKLDSLIFKLSEISMSMFNANKSYEYRRVYDDKGRFRLCVGQAFITPWGLNDVVYHAVNCCSDFHGRTPNKYDIPWIFAKFTDFLDREARRNVDSRNITELMYGLSQKQFGFQRINETYEQISRNIELLKVIPKQLNSKLPIELVMKEEIGMSLDDFNKILLIFSGRCTTNVDIANTSVDISLNKLDACFTQENVKKVLKYYSTSYEEIRKSELKANFLYTKPFILTDSGHTYASNCFAVTKKCADGAYWVLRNYYFKKGKQDFVNEFGVYFEQHFANVLERYLNKKQYTRLQASSGDKIADWIIYSPNYILLIEQKSGLASLKSKCEYPDLEDIKKFFNKFIEAFIQLDSSEKKIQEMKEKKTILKLAMHYEDFYLQSLVRDDLLKENKQEFSNVDGFFIVGISEMEKLISILSNDEMEYESILKDFVDVQTTENKGEGKELEYILAKHGVKINDYVSKKTNHLNEIFTQLLNNKP